MSQQLTLLDKIWQSHIVAAEPGCPSVLYIDLHLVHEVTSPQAFDGLRARGLPVRRPDRTFATIDHSIPTHDPSQPIADVMCAKQIAQLETNCREFGITLFGRGEPRRGVVHTIGPELGLTQPGQTVVFGIGTSEVEHVLATQCLLQRKPQCLRVEITGQTGAAPLPPGVTAKDVILALIGRIGIGGGTGQVIEYTGSAMRAFSMEERMTICNMTIEAGARAGMVAPDDATFEYLAGRPFAPQGADWDRAVAAWRALPSDEGAAYDRAMSLNVGALPPMITFGTNPGMVMTIVGHIPDPSLITTALPRQAMEKALAYMDLRPGEMLLGHPIDVVFLGSCTNGRISDLRMAAAMLKGRKVAPGVRMLVVPGSEQIKRQAETEGLDRIFKEAGAQWREPGCSMCIGMNGDTIQPGQYCVSTSNRNFEGRQGKGGRTLLASPLTAVASAVAGSVADPRRLT
jgi:3-isopropylmalate/(R)-2-methylmalate dehydratase large subunit